MCNEREARYRCPACDKQTCSVECVRKHKLNDNCTGSRHAKPVPRSQVDILADARFLDSAPLSANSTIEETKINNNSGKRRLEAACKSRQINLLLLPEQFSKAKENKSRVVGDIIIWTVRVNDCLQEMAEDAIILEHLKTSNASVKCERPTRWKSIDEKDTLRTVLSKETIIEFPEINTII